MNNSIRNRRKELGLTQQQLCDQAGICSKGHLSDIENLKKEPKVFAAKRIARALETTVEELFKSNEGGEDV